MREPEVISGQLSVKDPFKRRADLCEAPALALFA